MFLDFKAKVVHSECSSSNLSEYVYILFQLGRKVRRFDGWTGSPGKSLCFWCWLFVTFIITKAGSPNGCDIVVFCNYYIKIIDNVI